MKIVLGITGASGSIYAKNFLDISKKFKIFDDIAVIFTENGKKVWKYELQLPVSTIHYNIYNNDNFFVPFASGNSSYDAMVVLPCSMGTLAKIANGISDNLITRTADVMLKENKKLILVPREMPYNLIHIENMKKIILSGGIIIPASPSFYSKPKTIDDLILTVLQKIFNSLKIHKNFITWME